MQEWIVFDLDGTLIESEQIWRDVRRDFVIENDGCWREDAQKAMMGMRSDEWARYMHDKMDVTLPPTVIKEQVVERVIERFSRYVPILPGADEALARLAAAFRLGLATSSALAAASNVLEKTGWVKYFSVIVSADSVSRGKPAPDVYLRVLELLKADRRRTAAVEDSASGIRAANAAGLAVVAVPNPAFPPDADALALAARVIAHLDELDMVTIRSLREGGSKPMREKR